MGHLGLEGTQRHPWVPHNRLGVPKCSSQDVWGHVLLASNLPQLMLMTHLSGLAEPGFTEHIGQLAKGRLEPEDGLGCLLIKMSQRSTSIVCRNDPEGRGQWLSISSLVLCM